MHLITGGKRCDPAGKPDIGETVRVPLANPPSALGPTVQLADDGGRELALWHTADYLRSYLDGSTVVLTNEPEPVPEPPHVPTAAEQIAEKKEQLAATDYRIIKCSEFELAGVKPAPYDVAALHGERQALRDQINALETAEAAGVTTNEGGNVHE